MTRPIDLRWFIDRTDHSLKSGHYAQAFDLLRRGSEKFPDIRKDVTAACARYFYMLRFVAGGNRMTALDEEFARTARTIESLMHRIRLERYAIEDWNELGAQIRFMRLRPEENLQSLISDYITEAERLNTDTAALTDSRRRQRLEQLSGDIFMRTWAEYPLGDDNLMLLESVITDASLPAHDRANWAAALGMALQAHGERPVYDLLLRIYADDTDRALSCIAGMWLIIGAVYSSSLALPPLSEQLKALDSLHDGEADFLLTELARAVYPRKLPEGEDPRQLMGDLFKDVQSQIGNDPEKLRQLMSDPEALQSALGLDSIEKLRNFMEQMGRGQDVMRDALGQRSAYEFFARRYNWFMPFTLQHSALADVVDGEGAIVADTATRMGRYCDSDKYSLVLSMVKMPEVMRQKFIEQLPQQFYDLDIDALSKSADDPASRRYRIRMSMLDFSRFIHNYRDGEILSQYKSRSWDDIPASDTAAADIADILTDADETLSAINIYDRIFDSLSIQQLYRYGEAATRAESAAAAIKAYSRIIMLKDAEIEAAIWLARWHRADRGGEPSSTYLEPFADSHTDDPRFLIELAFAYIHDKKWNEALATFHNMDYIGAMPQSMKPDLAWVLTVTGQFAEAAALWDTIPDTHDPGEPQLSEFERSRKSAAYWLAGRRADAIDAWNDIPDPEMTFYGRHIHEFLFIDGLDNLLDSVPEVREIATVLPEAACFNMLKTEFGDII